MSSHKSFVIELVFLFSLVLADGSVLCVSLFPLFHCVGTFPQIKQIFQRFSFQQDKCECVVKFLSVVSFVLTVFFQNVSQHVPSFRSQHKLKQSFDGHLLSVARSGARASPGNGKGGQTAVLAQILEHFSIDWVAIGARVSRRVANRNMKVVEFSSIFVYFLRV